MRKQTYEPGKFSQIQLLDGSKYFVETGPVGIRIRKIGWIMPKELLWEYFFPFFIRTQWDAWELSNRVLDLVLAHCSRCQTEQEIQHIITEIEEDLQTFVQENFDSAYALTLKKAGFEIANEALENWKKMGYRFRERLPGIFEQFVTRLLDEIDKHTHALTITANQRLVLRACVDSAGMLAEGCQSMKKAAGFNKQVSKNGGIEAFLFLCISEIYIFSRTALAEPGITTLLGVW